MRWTSDRQTLLWSTGGVAVSCFLGACAVKAYISYNRRTFPVKISAGDVVNEIVLNRESSIDNTRKFDEYVTTYSQISLLMGSPTPSGVLYGQSYSPADGYPELSRNRTIMARYLTQELYEKLYNCRTNFGYDIDACIQTGVDNPEKYSCGIVAGDEECYELFANLFDPVITDRHRGFLRGNKMIRDMNVSDLKSDIFDSKYVKSTHFLVGRCLRGFRFPPSCRRAERKHVENILKKVLESLQDDFSGTYLQLTDLSVDQRYHLPDILQSVIDCPTSRTLIASGSTRDWPSGRGVFYSDDLNFFAWTNREDHLRLMYRDRVLDFVESYKHFKRGLATIAERISEVGVEYAYHDEYGFLLTCPSGIGTAIRAGVHMKLPNLLRDKRFRTILKNLRLHMGAEDQEMLRKGYLDVYNMDRLGYGECHLIQHVADSVHLLVEMERRLEHKQSISDLIVARDDNE